MKLSDLDEHLEFVRQLNPNVTLDLETRRLLRALAPILSSCFEPSAGGLRPQDVGHLDYLEAHVMAEGLVPEEVWLHIQGRNAVVLLDRRPVCDLCSRPARYDAPVIRLQGRWANLCPRCWLGHSYGRLGAGQGQLIGLYTALPAAAIRLVDGLGAATGRLLTAND